jgi:uncharacterized FlaG/YvyC family protein
MTISSTSLPHTPVQPAAGTLPLTPDQRELAGAIRAVNAATLLGQDNQLTFIMDRTTRKMIVRIVNRTTGDVVDQIPAQYVLNMAAQLAEENTRG